MFEYFASVKVVLAFQIHSDEEKRILTSTFVVGRIRKFHARKDLFGPTDAIDTGKMLPVSRIGGIGYGRTTDAYGEHEISSSA